MEIIVGENAGFCYGVKRAVEAATEIINKSEKEVYCLGEIVHNKQVVDELKNKGIKFVDDIKDVKDSTIIRAHGISKDVYEFADKNNIKLEDYTCTKVLAIHKIAEKYRDLGFFIFLLGSKNHPENIGTISFCGDNSYIIESQEDVKNALQVFNNSNVKKLLVISQTTFSLQKFSIIENEIKESLKDKNIEFIIKNTICKATEIRQKETDKLSKKVDYMIILGGKNSSNTKKLYEIAVQNCDSICIETVDDLDIDKVKKYKKIGIMAGASTPNKSIDDVVKTLSNLK